MSWKDQQGYTGSNYLEHYERLGFKQWKNTEWTRVV